MSFIQSAYAAAAVAPIQPVPAINFNVFVGWTINVLSIIVGVLAVLFLIYSGIQYITANGDPTKATAARQGIVNAIIGIIVVLLASSIVKWVMNATTLGTPSNTGTVGAPVTGTTAPKPVPTTK